MSAFFRLHPHRFSCGRKNLPLVPRYFPDTLTDPPVPPFLTVPCPDHLLFRQNPYPDTADLFPAGTPPVPSVRLHLCHRHCPLPADLYVHIKFHTRPAVHPRHCPLHMDSFWYPRFHIHPAVRLHRCPVLPSQTAPFHPPVPASVWTRYRKVLPVPECSYITPGRPLFLLPPLTQARTHFHPLQLFFQTVLFHLI